MTPKTITVSVPIYDLEHFGLYIKEQLSQWEDGLDGCIKYPDDEDEEFFHRCQAMVNYYQQLYSSLSTHLDIETGNLLYEFLGEF